MQQNKALVRLFKKMKDYVIENQEILNHRDFLRLSLQTAENAQNIVEVRQKLTEIDDKVENVVSNLGDMARTLSNYVKPWKTRNPSRMANLKRTAGRKRFSLPTDLYSGGQNSSFVTELK